MVILCRVLTGALIQLGSYADYINYTVCQWVGCLLTVLKVEMSREDQRLDQRSVCSCRQQRQRQQQHCLLLLLL